MHKICVKIMEWDGIFGLIVPTIKWVEILKYWIELGKKRPSWHFYLLLRWSFCSQWANLDQYFGYLSKIRIKTILLTIFFMFGAYILNTSLFSKFSERLSLNEKFVISQPKVGWFRKKTFKTKCIIREENYLDEDKIGFLMGFFEQTIFFW